MEMFIFDSMEHSHHVCALMVPRDEFAYVKNLEGENSPLSAMVAIGRVHQKWIIKAGGRFVGEKYADGDTLRVEISPLVSYEGEDIFFVVGKHRSTSRYILPGYILRGY